MSSRAVTARTDLPKRIPIFPIPELSILAIQALQIAELDKFYDLNRDVFTMLVSVIYVGFVERAAELGKETKAEKKNLFKIFCREILMFVSAASPQSECLHVQKPERADVARVNGLAREFLWNHLRDEGLVTWQDFYAEGKRQNPRVMGLVNDFVHFIVAKAFEGLAATIYITEESKLKEARRVIQSINTGEQTLKSI